VVGWFVHLKLSLAAANPELGRKNGILLRLSEVQNEWHDVQFEAEDPAFLTAVADDAGPDVPALLVGPTMLRYHSSEEKMALADIEGSERLLMLLLEALAVD